jgi:hypothetical protein
MKAMWFVALAVLSATPAPAKQPESTVIAQNPIPSHCNERPYSECIKCARERGFSRVQARAYCRPMR